MPQRFEDIEKSLYSGEKHPESEYELSETKLEEFISESIAQALAEERERMVGEIEKMKKGLYEQGDDQLQFNCGYNLAIVTLLLSLDKLTDKE